METGNSLSNLVKQAKDLIQHQTGDTDKYYEIYHELRDEFPLDQQDENFAAKIGALTGSQLYQLKSQVSSYKHLIRNITLPLGLLTSGTGVNPNLWASEKERLTQKAVNYYKEKIDRDPQLKNMVLTKMVIQSDSNDTQSRYEDIMKDQIDKRKQFIEDILYQPQTLSAETIRNLNLELKFLRLFDIYTDTRDKIVDSLQSRSRSTCLLERALLDRSMFRRDRPAKNRQIGNRVQKLESQMKSDYQRRKRLKHKEFFQQLCIHHSEFFDFHKRQQKQLKKRVNQAKNQYELNNKKKEDSEDKATTARLKALKQHDMDQYLKLVKQTKNLKIQELLEQTNNFLRQLGAKVLLQKGETHDQNEDLEITARDEEVQNSFFNANKVYYNLTHTIKQQITRQPTLLVGGELKPYQIIGLQWLVSLYNNNLNGILADEMGLGKTIQTISLLAHLLEFKKNYGPFLIIVPLSTMSNWQAEFNAWAPSIKKIIYKGSKGNRNQMAKLLKTTKWNVCITTYDFILRDRLNLNKYEWKYIIIDEGHRMKNAKGKFASVLGHQYQSTHRLLLTGTPLQNNLTELWALLNFLLPKVFSSCDDFQKWFSMPISKVAGGGQSVQLTEEEQLLIINRLHQVLRPFLLRRVKKQVESELPDKIEHVIKVQLSSWQKVIYNNIGKKGTKQIEVTNPKQNKKAMMNLMMQLRKICNHPYLFLTNYQDLLHNQTIMRTSGKFELLDRILPKLISFRHRVLIFSQMTTTMDIMQAYFDYRNIKHLRLDGGTKSDDRGERTKQFNKQDSEYDVFLLSTRAGGLGLNLQTADTVIIFDSDWNPQMDLQAQDRAHRIGQTKKVLVLRFVTNTCIEMEILAKAAYKKGLDQMFIQGGLYNLKSSEAQRRQKIEDLLKDKKFFEYEESDEIPGDDLINRYIARDQIEFEAFTKMDQERYDVEASKYKRFVDPRVSEKKVNYRLMGDEQIPEWLVESPKAEEETKEYGRGSRQRKRVNYNDDLTDLQFQKLVEEEEKESEEIKESERKFEEKRRGSKTAN